MILSREIPKMARGPIEKIGFFNVKGGIFRLNLTNDTSGWLGLPGATKKSGGRLFEINPVIGVRHQPLEKLTSELEGLPYDEYIPPSIMTPIGYIMPEKIFIGWRFIQETHHEKRIQEMVDAIIDYGLPYIMANDSLEKMVHTMLHGVNYQTHPHLRIPAGLYLLGRIDEAIDYIDKRLQLVEKRMTARHTPIDDDEIKFYSNLMRLIKEKSD
jgi:hypothetical protein